MDAYGDDDDAVASFAIARQNAALCLRAAALKEADPSYGDSDAEEPPADVSVPALPAVAAPDEGVLSNCYARPYYERSNNAIQASLQWQ